MKQSTTKNQNYISLAAVIAVLLGSLISGAAPPFSTLGRSMLFKKLNGTQVHHMLPDNCYKLSIDAYGYLWVGTQRGIFYFNGQEFEKLNIDCANEDFVYSVLDGPYLVVWNYLGEVFRIDTRTHRYAGIRSVSPWNRQAPVYNYYLRTNDSAFIVRLSGASIAFQKSRFLSTVPQIKGEKTDLSKESVLAYLKQKFPHSNLQDFRSAIERYEYNLWLNDSDFCLGATIFRTESGSAEPIYETPNKSAHVQAYWRRGFELWVNRSDGTLIYYPDYRIAQRDSAVLALDIQGVTLCGDKKGNLYLSTQENGILWIPELMTRTTYYPLTDEKMLFSQDIRYLRADRNKAYIGYKKMVVDILHHDGKTIRKQLDFPSGTGPLRLFYQKNERYSTFVSNSQIACLDELQNRILYPLGKGPVAIKDAYFRDSIAYINAKFGPYLIDTISSTRKTQLCTGLLPDYTLSFCPAFRNNHFLIGKNPIANGSDSSSVGHNILITKIRNFGGEILQLTASGIYYTTDSGGLTSSKLLFNKSGITDILWDGAEYYFVLSPYEVTRIKRTDKSQTTIIRQKDLPEGLQFNTFCILDSSLLLGCSKGILSVAPYQEHTADQCHQKEFRIINQDSMLTNYFANHSTHLWQKNLELKFKFDIPIYANQENANWVLLNDVDEIMAKGPVEHGSCSFVPTTPGKYKMCIRCTNKTGASHIAAIYTIDILPRWWQMMSVKLLLILLGIALIAFTFYDYAKRRQEKRYLQLRQRHNFLSAKNKLQLSRLKPHFIFNAFNPLQKYIICNQKKEALQYIYDFSALMRSSISIFDSDFISLSTELEFIQLYINIQKERFDHDFTFTTAVSPDLASKNLSLPPMLLQPILENSIEYGMPFWTEQKRKGQISLRINPLAQGNGIEITIEDDGPGYPESFTPKSGHGLNLVTERIRLVQNYLGTASIHFSNSGSGAQTTICLPLISSPKHQ